MFDTMRFEDFSFEVIDVSVTGKPDIHITQNGITFTRRLVQDMGYPPYIMAMMDGGKKVFAIKVCKADNENAMPFSKPKAEQRGALITSSGAIRQMIRGVMGDRWEAKNRYHITGVWYAEAKAMVFDLNAAKERPPFLMSGIGKQIT